MGLLLSECAYNREILSLFRRIITFGGSLPFVRDLPTTLIATFGGLLLSLSGGGGGSYFRNFTVFSLAR